MSYLVFARKWRPQRFQDVLAQDHITVTLRNAIKTDRIGHSYLMTGPRGVGKTTTARILAKALNCAEGPTPDPCQVCDSCRRITAGSHLDVMEIDGASNRGIDQIRELREKAMYATASGRYRVYIIDEVHMLTTEAFNALLKILEEPPESVVFIFATTQPRRVPDTIVSRCQRFDFRRIPVPEMAEYLRREAGGEDITLDDAAVGLICRASGGSMRDALSLMDQLVSFCGADITGEAVASLLGMVESELLAELTGRMLAGDSAALLESVAGALSRGYSVEELLDALVEFLRNLLVVTSGAPSGLEDVPEEERARLLSLARGVPDLIVLNALRLLSSAATEARRSSLPRVVLETALVAASKAGSAFRLADMPGVAESLATVAAPSEADASGGGEATPERGEPGSTASVEEPTAPAAADDGPADEAPAGAREHSGESSPGEPETAAEPGEVDEEQQDPPAIGSPPERETKADRETEPEAPDEAERERKGAEEVWRLFDVQ